MDDGCWVKMLGEGRENVPIWCEQHVDAVWVGRVAESLGNDILQQDAGVHDQRVKVDPPDPVVFVLVD